MVLIKAEDDKENELMDRYVSEDMKLEMGIFKVLFGWRVRVGKVGDFMYSIDWCCGNKLALVIFTHGLVKRLIEDDYLNLLPGFSMVKPWPKDPNFVEKLKPYCEAMDIDLDEVLPVLMQ